MYATQPYAVLENVVVDERYQTKGYGTALIRHVEEFCHRADCWKIMLQSHSSRHIAHGFFEKMGFSAVNKRGFVKYRSQMKPVTSYESHWE
jgi:GNAT superfamily N-acetyltransferase